MLLCHAHRFLSVNIHMFIGVCMCIMCVCMYICISVFGKKSSFIATPMLNIQNMNQDNEVFQSGRNVKHSSVCQEVWQCFSVKICNSEAVIPNQMCSLSDLPSQGQPIQDASERSGQNSIHTILKKICILNIDAKP